MAICIAFTIGWLITGSALFSTPAVFGGLLVVPIAMGGLAPRAAAMDHGRLPRSDGALMLIAIPIAAF